MPSIAGQPRPLAVTSVAPRPSARAWAAAASLTRKAMATALGPCSLEKSAAWLSSWALIRKLMSPWRWRVMSCVRCLATAGKPNLANRSRSSWGSGAAYSTNSKPSVPIGFSRPSGPFSSVAVAIGEYLLVSGPLRRAWSLFKLEAGHGVGRTGRRAASKLHLRQFQRSVRLPDARRAARREGRPPPRIHQRLEPGRLPPHQP